MVVNDLVEGGPIDLALTVELGDLDSTPSDQVFNRFRRSAQVLGSFWDSEQTLLRHTALCGKLGDHLLGDSAGDLIDEFLSKQYELPVIADGR